MSSIATFYLLATSKQESFREAKRTERTETFKRGLFFTKKIVSGDRHLWEFLDEESDRKLELPFSGFVLIDYFFTFLQLPDGLHAALTAAAVDEHHTWIDAALAGDLVRFLGSQPPDDRELSEFAAEQEMDPARYPEDLKEAHRFLLDWLRQVDASRFGVLHITF
jgi:hypothetical protein